MTSTIHKHNDLRGRVSMVIKGVCVLCQKQDCCMTSCVVRIATDTRHLTLNSCLIAVSEFYTLCNDSSNSLPSTSEVAAQARWLSYSRQRHPKHLTPSTWQGLRTPAASLLVPITLTHFARSSACCEAITAAPSAVFPSRSATKPSCWINSGKNWTQ